MTLRPTTRDRTPAAAFTDVLERVEPIRLSEPLAQTLGAFDGESAVVEYSYVDVVKMAGHACPTTAAAFECCRAALARLYPDEMPVRGNIEATVYGEPDDGVYGVIGQVFSLITGAASETGFKGLATFYRRKDLLKYEAAKPDATSMTFLFKRKDTGRTVRCRIDPDRLPERPPEEAGRIGGLLKKVLWEAASKAEIEDFRNLWRRGVTAVFESATQDNQWFAIEEVK